MIVFMVSSLKTKILNDILLVAKKYNTYMSQLVSAFVVKTPYKVNDYLKNLLWYLAQATIDIHQVNIKPEATLPNANT